MQRRLIWIQIKIVSWVSDIFQFHTNGCLANVSHVIFVALKLKFLKVSEYQNLIHAQSLGTLWYAALTLTVEFMLTLNYQIK